MSDNKQKNIENNNENDKDINKINEPNKINKIKISKELENKLSNIIGNKINDSNNISGSNINFANHDKPKIKIMNKIPPPPPPLPVIDNIGNADMDNELNNNVDNNNIDNNLNDDVENKNRNKNLNLNVSSKIDEVKNIGNNISLDNLFKNQTDNIIFVKSSDKTVQTITEIIKLNFEMQSKLKNKYENELSQYNNLLNNINNINNLNNINDKINDAVNTSIQVNKDIIDKKLENLNQNIKNNTFLKNDAMFYLSGLMSAMLFHYFIIIFRSFF